MPMPLSRCDVRPLYRKHANIRSPSFFVIKASSDNASKTPTCRRIRPHGKSAPRRNTFCVKAMLIIGEKLFNFCLKTHVPYVHSTPFFCCLHSVCLTKSHRWVTRKISRVLLVKKPKNLINHLFTLY